MELSRRGLFTAVAGVVAAIATKIPATQAAATVAQPITDYSAVIKAMPKLVPAVTETPGSPFMSFLLRSKAQVADSPQIEPFYDSDGKPHQAISMTIDRHIVALEIDRMDEMNRIISKCKLVVPDKEDNFASTVIAINRAVNNVAITTRRAKANTFTMLPNEIVVWYMGDMRSNVIDAPFGVIGTAAAINNNPQDYFGRIKFDSISNPDLATDVLEWLIDKSGMTKV